MSDDTKHQHLQHKLQPTGQLRPWTPHALNYQVMQKHGRSRPPVVPLPITAGHPSNNEANWLLALAILQAAATRIHSSGS